MPLSELKQLKIASGEPDIRGWSVFTSSGRELGEIDDLLVDTSRGEVVMLDIGLRGSDRHSLAPIRAAWIDRKTKRVVLDGAQFNAEEELPSLTRAGQLTDDEVRRFGERYRSTYGDRGFDDSDWRLRHRNDELRFGRRSAELGKEPPPARDATIERRPLRADDPDWASAPRVEERELRLPADERAATVEQKVVEEVVVRRRLVDAEEAERIAREKGSG
jgi:sporulation protein YlmC with PRC-barrel domain